MYPVDIRAMAHVIIFVAITCGGCSLGLIEPRLEFATQREYEFWIVEQVSIQADAFYCCDMPQEARKVFWRDVVLRPLPGDLISEQLLKFLSNDDLSSHRDGVAEVVTESYSLSVSDLYGAASQRVIYRYHDLDETQQLRIIRSIIKDLGPTCSAWGRVRPWGSAVWICTFIIHSIRSV
jgi:hypothetical protein